MEHVSENLYAFVLSSIKTRTGLNDLSEHYDIIDKTIQRFKDQNVTPEVLDKIVSVCAGVIAKENLNLTEIQL